ncbi:tyrosine-protein phosphatase [Paraburkholderia dinghuensis]|uniref:Tyrosine-protein phosphatase n=1 Tax=Paraburkholderia dinghuensis TaxID=2305225 RepID=A0A3N6N289_9BURK|nr:tyrosine-protein phosphatase [Paraburkholderia dinghuensis]RQH04661.1 tyrosine-protein phosphatase [Paraburkholderia dinghuensis]
MIPLLPVDPSSLTQAGKPLRASVTSDFTRRSGATPASPQRRALLKGSVSVLALGGCASTLLSACGGDYTGVGGSPDELTPVVNSIANFRDVAGASPGYATSDGAHVRRAWVYRCDALTPNAADAATLQRMALAYVYDLHAPADAGSAPDTVPGTASYLPLNVLGTLVPPSFAGMQAAELDAAMQTYWNALVTGRAQCAAYGTLLQHIADAPGPHLICGGPGVDVVGWASALLLLIANVPLEIVVEDFLLTNAWRSTGVDAANVAPPVQQSYIQAAFDALQTNYGDLSRYLTTGLGLASATLDRLRSRLVV